LRTIATMVFTLLNDLRDKINKQWENLSMEQQEKIEKLLLLRNDVIDLATKPPKQFEVT
jgi:hypothetical protein